MRHHRKEQHRVLDPTEEDHDEVESGREDVLDELRIETKSDGRSSGKTIDGG